ncbi:hypothetical protein PIB30_005153 [Stylosanthes scabra]|uniref:Uncharacterized protein n=1 Tax=Stylosanthes scabra TaxID=79078 RepID=A0ABU6R2Q6_9FABA|nr:hypothetical protein [Stylosanthes scabra]
MPIYHDYHGDSRSSSISTWDQIQISLKSLLPSYEPILCDSAIVASFLSDQPQEHISAEPNSVLENSNPEIDNTDQELTTDPTQFYQIQEITDLDFQFQSELATTRSSKFKFNQNSTTPTEAGDYSGFQEITRSSGEEVTIIPYGGANGWTEGDRQWSESVMDIRDCLRSVRKEGREEELWVPLAKPPRPCMTESGLNSRVAIGAEDGTAAKGRIEATALKPAVAAEAIRPPPAPPDPDPALILGSALPYTADRVTEPEEGDVGGGTTAKGTENNVRDLQRACDVDRDSSSAADGSHMVETRKTISAVGKGAAVEDGATKMRGGGCAGVVNGSASVRKREAPFCRRLILTAKPPPLLAAVFPWDRECGLGTEKKQEMELVKGAFDGGAHGHRRRDFEVEANAKSAMVELVATQGWERQKVDGDGVSLLLQCEKEQANRMGQERRWFGNPNSIGLGPIRVSLLPVLFSCYSKFGSSLVWLILVHGPLFFQWDPGGQIYFWAVI